MTRSRSRNNGLHEPIELYSDPKTHTIDPTELDRMRSILGWNRERMAGELGISFATLDRWEKGRAKPSPGYRQLLEALVRRINDDIRVGVY